MSDVYAAIKSLIQEPVGILGFGAEGQSTLKILHTCGVNNIVIFDKDPTLNELSEIKFYNGTDYLSHLNKVKTLIRSAGIRPDLSEINAFTIRGGRLLSQLEILFEVYPLDKIIGITGTLGKGTTATLIFEMMERGGLSCLLGENIGIPMLDLLQDSLDCNKYLILELSSFQLSTATKSPGTAVVLKTTEEHLDWHTDIDEYWKHKSNISRYQKKTDTVFYYSDNKGSAYIGNLSGGNKKSYGTEGDLKIDNDSWILDGEVIPLANHKIKGNFNLENIAAAALVAESQGVSYPNIKTSALEFTGLKHRLEYLGKTDVYSFYNDSYATRPDATIGAINSFHGLKMGLILGGSEKNADFSKLAETIIQSRYLSHIAFIGDTAERMMQAIQSTDKLNTINTSLQTSLFDAVDYLINHLEKGVIILSPACASFGLFRNYRERGEEFRNIVYAHIYSTT